MGTSLVRLIAAGGEHQLVGALGLGPAPGARLADAAREQRAHVIVAALACNLPGVTGPAATTSGPQGRPAK